MINTQRITSGSFQTPRVNWGSWQAQGLLGWYPMAHPGGRILFDCTGHQIHGTFDATNPPKWDWQDGYPVLRFGDANVDEVKFSRAIIPVVGLASMWLWLKNNGNTFSGAPANCTADVSADASHYPFSGSDTTGLIYSNWLINSRLNSIDDGGFNKGQWHSVGVTNQNVTSTGYKFYQNGKELAAMSGHAADVPADANWLLGHFSGFQRWPGWIGEVRFYNRVLSPGEVKELAHPLARLDLRAPTTSRTWFIPGPGAGGGAAINGGMFSAQTGF